MSEEEPAMLKPASACVLSSALVLGASAQAAPVPDPAAAQVPASAPTPSEADAHRLHKLVEGWLAAGSVPERTAAALWADKAVGVVVTLRLEGVTMGRGSAVCADLGRVLDGREAGPMDLVPLLMRASRTAFAKAEARLAETSGSDRHLLAAMATTLCVDVQLGHSPKPVLLMAGQGAGALFGQVIPGWHGLALRAPGHPGSAPALVWPGTLSADGIALDTAISQLLVDQKVGPAEAQKLAQPGGPELACFEVWHVVRPRPNLPAMTLTRGTTVVPADAINKVNLRLISGQMARHLLAGVTAEGSLRGGYLPAQDQWLPATAPPSETALAAYALVRVAAGRMNTDPQDPLAQQCVRAASALAKKLAPKVSDSKAAPQPLAAAFLLMALTDAPGAADRDWRDRLAADLMALDAGDKGYAVAEPAAGASGKTELKPVNRTTGAILTCALAGWYERTRNAKAEALVRRQLGRAFGGSAGFESVDAAYWLALAERRAGGLLAATDKDPAGAKAAHAARLQRLGRALAEMRAAQITRRPETGPADTVGGFSFTPGLALPTWRSAFPLALWAQLLHEPAVIGAAHRSENLLGIGQGARFLAQLMVTPAACFAARQPGLAVGGVRGAPWETRLDNQPAAMALLALEEVIEGVEAVEAVKAK